MRGSIRERSPGHWAIILDQRDPATGKRKRKWHSYEGTKRQAQVECARLISEMKGGAYVEPSKLTLSNFFERWLKHVMPNVSPRTHERYSDLLTKNLAPVIGAKLLSKLQPIEISEAYGKLLESGRRDGNGGLSPRTVHHVHRVFYEALDQAERWKLIARNPAALLEKRDRPKIEKKPVVTIDAPTTATVFEPPASGVCLFPWFWRAYADCAAARLRPCAGAPSIWTTASWRSSPAPNRRTPAKSERRKPRAARSEPSPCPLWPSKNCNAGG